MKQWTRVVLGLGCLLVAGSAAAIDPNCEPDIIGPAGIVDAVDITAVIEGLGGSLALLDFNGDGEVGGLDLTMALDSRFFVD